MAADVAALGIQLIASAEPTPTCAGQIYRFIETAYLGKGGRLVCRKELRPMKRLSCPGCLVCGGRDDHQNGMAEKDVYFLQFSNDLESGDLVELLQEIDDVDRETGSPEVWHYNVVRYSAGS